MRIGIAGPASLRLLRGLEDASCLPAGYEHPPMSAFVNALLDRGFDVTLFTTSTGLEAPLILRKPALTVCIARRQKHAARDLFRSERKELLAFMNQYPTDVLNAHWSYEFAWAALDTGRPTLVTMRDHAPTILKYNPNPYRFMRLLMNQYVLRRAPFLSTNSQYLFDKLPPRHRRKAKVIHNFFSSSLDGFRNPYCDRDHVVVSVSNGFGPWKNIQTGLRAFALVRNVDRSLRYQLIGDDMEPGGPANGYALQAGVADGVEFLGKLSYSETLNRVCRAKLMLHPSLEESFGMSVLESMVIGTPVIGGTSSGNIPALLDHGKCGVLCDVANPREIAAATMELLSNTSRAAQIARTATTFAESRFSEEAVISSYVGYYSDILRDWS